MAYRALLETDLPREITSIVLEYAAADPETKLNWVKNESGSWQLMRVPFKKFEQHWWQNVNMLFDLHEDQDGRTFLEKFTAAPGVARSLEPYSMAECYLFNLLYHESDLLLEGKTRRQILLNREWRNLRLEVLCYTLQLVKILRVNRTVLIDYLQGLFLNRMQRLPPQYRDGVIGLSKITWHSWTEAELIHLRK